MELEKELARLERSLALGADATRPVELDQQAVGRLSRMDSIQNQHMSRDLSERQEARVGAIQSALDRISSGSYGRCIQCGNEIESGRLYVMPEVEHCSGCGEGGPQSS